MTIKICEHCGGDLIGGVHAHTCPHWEGREAALEEAIRGWRLDLGAALLGVDPITKETLEFVKYRIRNIFQVDLVEVEHDSVERTLKITVQSKPAVNFPSDIGSVDRPVPKLPRGKTIIPKSSWETYPIWSEGYAATGEHGEAVFHGSEKGDSFKDACKRFALLNPSFANFYNEEKNTYWGCRLFDNEADARESFG